MAKKQQEHYGNSSISMLKGEDRVRKRPAVIFGSDDLEGCKHAVFEILSNAIDEARDGELHIAIRAWVTEKDRFFSGTDDGLGIPPQRLPELLNASGTTGFGLKNVHERIRLTYGPEYGLTIHSVEDEGTTVTIRIPRGWEEDRA